MLGVENVSGGYGLVSVINGVSLELKEGETKALIGANKAGKSTIFRFISGLLPPRSGKITFNGIDVTGFSPRDMVNLGIVLVPEGRRLFIDMTVLENLRMGSFIKSAKGDRQANMDRCFQLFPRLMERAKQLGGTMSGGEQQMLAIARGLMANPRLLLLDEPSLGLAPLLVKFIFDIIQEINKQGVTVLLVEQNVYQSLRIAHRAYVLETGRVALTGTGEGLLSDEHVKSAFLGM